MKPRPVRSAAKVVDMSRSTRQLNADLPTLVGDLNRRFRLGAFDHALFTDAERVLELTVNVSPVANQLVLRARCLAAEILELQGKITLAQDAVREGADLFARLQSGPPPAGDHDSLRLAREQVRFGADYSRFHLYRRGRYSEAKQQLAFYESLTRKSVQREGFRCHATLGLLNYYSGCAERQQGNLDAADRHYEVAIREYKRRSELVDLNAAARRDQETALVRHNTAVILGLGLGWTNSQRGFLTKALQNSILPAQVLLADSSDTTHRAYLDLISGAISRSLAGESNPELLEEAKRSIAQANRAFTTAPYCHEAYAIRAEYELSLCALSAQQLDEAVECIGRMDGLARKLDDRRWQAMVSIVRSRIAIKRNNFPEALKHAETAAALAEGQEESLGRIDAGIARADALLKLGEVPDAHHELAKALEVVRQQATPNQKIESVIRLKLALVHLAEGRVTAAEEEYGQWKQREQVVEHELVREMGRDVERRLRNLTENFFIEAGTKNVNHTYHNRRMRAWLILRARRLYPRKSKEELATLLGITRPTLHNWEVELSDELAGKTPAGREEN